MSHSANFRESIISDEYTPQNFVKKHPSRILSSSFYSYFSNYVTAVWDGTQVFTYNSMRFAKYIKEVWNVVHNGGHYTGYFFLFYYRPPIRSLYVRNDADEIICPLCFYNTEITTIDHKARQCAKLFNNSEKLKTFKLIKHNEICWGSKSLPENGRFMGVNRYKPFPSYRSVHDNPKYMYAYYLHSKHWEWQKSNYVKGTTWKFVKTEYTYSNEVADNCCINFKHPECPKILLTYHDSACDTSMSKYCKNNPTQSICLEWLEASAERNNKIALELYKNFCQTNLGTYECDFFINVVRKNPKLYSYGDIAIDTYCKNNPSDTRCFCSFTPVTIADSLINAYGNKECFLSYCLNIESFYFLKYYNYKNKKTCNELNCIITIDDLKLTGEALINVMNDCLFNNKLMYKNEEEQSAESKLLINYFSISIEIFIILLGFIIFFLFQKRKIIFSKFIKAS